MEYMIQENTLVEIADALRDKLIYSDVMSSVLGESDRIESIAIPVGTTEIYSYAFDNFTNLASVTIPNTVTIINAYAFYGCTSLSSITTPDSVTYISYQAFKNSGLKYIYLYSTTPPTLSDIDAFPGFIREIHVPVGSGDAYKTATNWSNFSSKIVEDIAIE